MSLAVLKVLISLGPSGTAQSGHDKIPSNLGLIARAGLVSAISLTPSNKFSQIVGLCVQCVLSLSSSTKSSPKYCWLKMSNNSRLMVGGKRKVFHFNELCKVILDFCFSRSFNARFGNLTAFMLLFLSINSGNEMSLFSL